MSTRARSATHAPSLVLTRRRFLQAAAALGGAAALAELPWFGDVAEALGATPPTPPGAGSLVVVELRGGNDALNTLVPYASGRYRDLRGALAIDPGSVLPLDAEVGLHPALPGLAARWQRGQVAIVEGVGAPSPDLSHFMSMARWMSATDAVSPASGWLGRFLDGLGPGALFGGVTIGSEVPLLVTGVNRTATALTANGGSFGTSDDPGDRRLYRVLEDLSAVPSSRGALADALAACGGDLVDVATTTAPLRAAALPPDGPARSLAFAARLLNARVGVRVLHVAVGGYDTHASQLGWHARLLTELDQGLEQFFGALDPTLAGGTVVMVVSEFGRTATANDSGGTDHGTAGVALLVGERVRGGRHGTPASLTRLGDWGRQQVTIDQRSVFATVLAGWLGADDREVLGVTVPHLDLFRAAPDATPTPSSSNGTAGAGRVVPVSPTRVLDTRVGTGATGPVPPGGVIELALAAPSGTLPAAARCVVLNVTVTGATADAYATLWPSGEPRPLASNLNVTPGRTVPNLAVVKLGIDGRVSLFHSAGTAHYVADLVGYAGDVNGSTLVPIDPFRLVDSRVDGTPLTADRPRTVVVAGVGDVPTGAVTGVVLNATVIEASADAYLTVWPSGERRPLASNVNVASGGTVPNLVLAKLGTQGAVDMVLSNGTADVALDVVGFLTSASSGSELHAVTPTRLLDTRDGTGGGRRLGPKGTMDVVVTGAAGVPPGASGVVVNLTATGATSPGFVTLWPTGRPRPSTSSLNLTPGGTVANLALSLVGDGGRVSLFNAIGATDLVVDIVGWLG